MKINELLRLAALNAQTDKEAIRSKVLSGKKKAPVWLNPKTAAVAASLIFVLLCLAVFKGPHMTSPRNESESDISSSGEITALYSGSEVSDMVYTTALPQDGEIVIEDALKAELENALENDINADYTITVKIYSSDFDMYKSERLTQAESTDEKALGIIEDQYRSIEENYFKSLGFKVEKSDTDTMTLIITGKVEQILNMKVPKGKAFVFYKSFSADNG
ncbi:MAG: hypothetical protein PHW77_04460 [Eubacteriales bacterium]|nr:hypothetical protein [Eubacteriales bacterium]